MVIRMVSRSVARSLASRSQFQEGLVYGHAGLSFSEHCRAVSKLDTRLAPKMFREGAPISFPPGENYADFFLAALAGDRAAAGAGAGVAAPGLGRSAAKNSAVGSVLMTSFFSNQPRRAVITPYFIILKCVDECASVEITTFTPRSRHMRR